QLKKPIKCTKRMGLLESIRDYQFHRNLAREDEICLHLQWKEDGMAEGKEIGMAEGKEIGITQGKEIGMAEGKEIGIAQGLEQGLKQAYNEKLTIARNLLAKGSTSDFVSEITGLSLEEIAKL
ncbi:MAG: hypothetical protein FWC01_09595, partial [Treponema sp.]|nr:hypothetical protein [Treponema sp.]MCL2238194.1 hypothetical protein [Treponema sp.]